MKKQLRAILFGVLMLIGVLGAGARTEAATVSLKYNVTYKQSTARQVFSYVNSLRTGSNSWYWNSSNTTKIRVTGLKSLRYDYTLEKTAMERAKELALSYSHTRPNNSSCFTAYSGYYTAAENIAASTANYSAKQIFTLWEEANKKYDGQGHRRNMLKSNINAIGIGVVECNGRYFYAMALAGKKSVNTSQTTAVNSTKTVTTSVDSSKVTYSRSASTVNVKVGSVAVKPTISARTTSTWSYANSVPLKNTITWSSANSSIAKLNGNYIVGVKAGTTKVYATFLGRKMTIPVTVKSSSSTTTNTKVTITGVKLDCDESIFFGSGKDTLKVTITPANATISKTLTWSSSNTSVARVSSSGVVTALKKGTAYITVRTSNGLTARCKISVY